MQEERSMILNMLKEGKISVDEAEALLEVLNDAGDEENGGFAAAGAHKNADGSETAAPGGERAGGAGPGAGPGSGGASAGHGKHRAFKIDLDLGNLKESLRETMKGVSESVRGVVDELADLDLGGEIFRAMGKVRAEAEDEISQDAADADRLEIRNNWGDIRINGTDDNLIRVRTRAVAWGASQEEADESARQVSIGLEAESGAWHVRSGLEGSAVGRVRLDYEIEVPRRFSVAASSASGDIWIEELDGGQTVKSASGDINVADIGSDRAQPQVMKSSSGDIVGGALTGEIQLSSASGDVEINGFTGSLKVSTQSGDITVHDGSGSVELRTMSGDIEAGLDDLGADAIVLSSVSGDVELEVPSDSGLDISVKSTSGEIDVDLDAEVHESGKRKYIGTFNGGGQELQVNTVSGDISISD